MRVWAVFMTSTLTTGVKNGKGVGENGRRVGYLGTGEILLLKIWKGVPEIAWL
jgi:hypothetical protein